MTDNDHQTPDARQPTTQIITDAVPIPPPRRLGRPQNRNQADRPNKAKYPFNELPEPRIVQDDQTGPRTIYSSFHVPVTPECPEPWKKMSATCSAANKRFRKLVRDPQVSSEPFTVQTRKFRSFRVDDTDPQGPGVRVFRFE